MHLCGISMVKIRDDYDYHASNKGDREGFSPGPVSGLIFMADGEPDP